MSIIKNHYKYISNESRMFKENKTEITRLNKNLLKGLLISCVIVFCSVSIIGFLANGYEVLRIVYIILTIVSLILMLIENIMPTKLILPTFYILFVMLILYAGYSAGYVFPDYAGVIIIGIFIIMPILILDKSIRLVAIDTIELIIYLIAVIPMKISDIRYDELIYVVAAYLIGLILGFSLRRTRLENIDLLKKSRIRETTDVLTGLLNRRRLFEYFGECETGKTKKIVTGISIMDIDFFKVFNDTFGHLAGDKCLQSVGNCMKEYGLKHNMEFYRYGGEEFVAISHEQDKEKLVNDFKGIVSEIEKLQITHKKDFVTISEGIYLLSEDDNINKELISEDENIVSGFQQYLIKADNALYEAKSKGRNRAVFDKN